MPITSPLPAPTDGSEGGSEADVASRARLPVVVVAGRTDGEFVAASAVAARARVGFDDPDATPLSPDLEG